MRVGSEVGRLRRALVHEPGPEIDLMVPRMMDELLFDDILHGEAARDEHRRFRRILQLLGVEAVEALDLLAGALAVEAGRHWVEDRVLPMLDPEYRERLRALDAEGMARALVEGVRKPIDDPVPPADELFGIRPLPNWCFQRDTQVVLGGRVLFSEMASPARQREAVLSRAIFQFHPELATTPVLDGRSRASRSEGEPGIAAEASPSALPAHDRASLEGGDVLVLSEEIVAVGHSERTTPAGIERLVRALTRREQGPRWLFAISLPHERAYMHLDTLMTPVGPGSCLVFPPVLLPGHPTTAVAREYDLHREDPVPVERGDLLDALSRRGRSYEPIPCGGPDPMDQQREQWTDGANALALAPDVVVLYDRNVRTAEEMDRRGYRVVRTDELLLGAEDVDLEEGEKICILTPSNELSRARGGPHCLTHPLVRDPI